MNSPSPLSEAPAISTAELSIIELQLTEFIPLFVLIFEIILPDERLQTHISLFAEPQITSDSFFPPPKIALDEDS